MSDTDLLGAALPPEPQFSKLTGKPKRKTVPAGYAARPGSGPAGETCGTCVHKVTPSHSGRFRKCALMHRVWTGGPKTDILARSPACRHWAPRCPDMGNPITEARP